MASFLSMIAMGTISKDGVLFALPANEVIGWLIFLIFFLVPVIGQVLSRLKAVPPPKGVPRPGQPVQPGQPVRPAQPPVPAAVQTEIEEFLRRANQKKAPPANRSARPARPAQQPAVRGRSAERPVRAEIVRAEAVQEQPLGSDVERHVKKYLDEEEFERRTKKLGEEVVESDEKIERHLKSVFNHSLSKIAAKPGETASPPTEKLADTAPQLTIATPSVAAGDVAALFGNPLSIRQAVILSEILSRPLDRWELEPSTHEAPWERRGV